MPGALILLDYQYIYAYDMLGICLWIGEGNREIRNKAHVNWQSLLTKTLAISQCDYASFTCLVHLG
jgi:hypothetical protein